MSIIVPLLNNHGDLMVSYGTQFNKMLELNRNKGLIDPLDDDGFEYKLPKVKNDIHEVKVNLSGMDFQKVLNKGIEPTGQAIVETPEQSRLKIQKYLAPLNEYSLREANIGQNETDELYDIVQRFNKPVGNSIDEVRNAQKNYYNELYLFAPREQQIAEEIARKFKL